MRDPESAGVRRPSVLRTANLPSRLIMFMAFAGMSAVNYAFGLAAGWLLSPGDFGLLAFAQTLLTLAGLVLNSGFVWALTAALVDADEARRAGLVRGAIVANLLLGVAVSAGILILFASGLFRSGLESWAAAVLVTAALPLLSVVAIARAAAQGSEHFGVLATLLVVETVIKAVAGVGLVLAGFGVLGAIAGFLIGALGTAVLGLAYLVLKLHIPPLGRLERLELRTAGAMFAALLGMAMLLNLDTMSMKLLLPGDRAAVGHYQAGIVLANLPYYLLTATIPVLFTQLARAKHITKTLPMVADTVRMALLVLLPIEALMAAFPELFLKTLFPAAYLAGAPTLRILAVANAAIILVAVLSTAFQATGNPGTPGRILLVITAVEAVVLGAVVPVRHGAGAAYTFLAATLVALLVLAVLYCLRLGAWPDARALAWLPRYVLAVAAGVATCAVMLELGAGGPIAVAMAGSAYIAATLGLRLVSLRSLMSPSAAHQPAAVAGEERS